MNCKIWQNKDSEKESDILSDAQLSRLFEDPLFKNCPNIGLAGGEPTISPFFWRLLKILPKDKHITITTNALANKKLKFFLDGIDNPDNFLIQVSLDGIAKNNDRIRGIPGAYDKTIELLNYLKKHNIKRLVSFTINRLNYHELLACYDLSEKYDAQFSTRIAYCGGAYENRDEKNQFNLLPDELSAISQSINHIISSEIAKPAHFPPHLVFLDHITEHAAGTKKQLPCLALNSGLVIDLYGNVFPNCPAIMTPIGSLHQQRLEDIWGGEPAQKMRKKIAQLQCGGCWNDCQVVTNIEYNKQFLNDNYERIKKDWVKTKQIDEKCIDFKNKNHAYLMEGWYSVEGNSDFSYAWTKPSFAFLIPKGISWLQFNAMVPDSILRNDMVQFKIEYNGTIHHHEIEAERGWRKYHITLDSKTNDLKKCKVSLPVGYCPQENGDGEDIRTLGMAISKIDFF